MRPALTPEFKAKFLQHYAGIGINMKCIAKTFQLPDRTLNGVLLNDKREHTLYLSKDGYSDFYSPDEWIAELRSIADLTDEEIQKIRIITGACENKDIIKSVKLGWISFLQNLINDNLISFSLYQYLQSIGIALPLYNSEQNRTVSAEELIEAGYAKYRMI